MSDTITEGPGEPDREPFGDNGSQLNAGASSPGDAGAEQAVPEADRAGHGSPADAAAPESSGHADHGHGDHGDGEHDHDAPSHDAPCPAAGRADRRGAHRVTPAAIPSSEDCVRAIANTAGLLAMGMMDPARARAICGAFGQILQYHKSRATEAGRGLDNADLFEAMRTHPDMLHLLAPLLTDAQVEMLLSQYGDEDRQT